MGYKHKTTGALEKYLPDLPSKVRNILIFISSPWGSAPKASLFEWLGMQSLHRIKVVFNPLWASVILYLVLKLQSKVMKLAKDNSSTNSMA